MASQLIVYEDGADETAVMLHDDALAGLLAGGVIYLCDQEAGNSHYHLNPELVWDLEHVEALLHAVSMDLHHRLPSKE